MSLLYEALLALVVSLGFAAGGFWYGNKHGIDHQKVIDQQQFDKINAERADQKAQASALLEKIQAGIIATQQHEQELKRQLEQKDADYSIAIDGMRADFARRGLRFVAPAKGGADRTCRAGATPPATSASGVPAITLIELPIAIASDLRQLAYDADRLKGWYDKCVGYVNGEVNAAQ